VGDVHRAIMATVGGINAAITVEGRERYAVNVRYPRELRDNIEKIRQVVIPAMGGAQIPLGQVARVEARQGVMIVKTEGAFPVTNIFVDMGERDVGSYVREAQQVVAEQFTLPPGYSLMWSGQYEFMQRVAQKLRVVIPVTLGIIFLLLYLNFQSTAKSLIVMLGLPFSLVGGVWFLWLLGYNTSVAVWVGFIALAGVAAQTGVLMMIYLDEAFERRRLEGRMVTGKDVCDAVRDGALERLRPVIMTVTAIIGGLAPIMWSGGAGADVMKRVAAPMVGGMISATVLTLAVIPAVYLQWRGWQVSHRPEPSSREILQDDIALSA